ncbi:reticulon-like protein B12 isoform X1 [Eucalyptus grandis]|uniref:reticulon-like protein B12 isoform X1 n=1 Tax=Eucalyptus grandis TaxID=71139 RepID=UPI00192EC3B2|nr:reticulon-like protein B12 isoform X1 [Eucalyptus grandis]
MGSSDRLFNRQRTVHEVLGGGLVADVILWRRSKLTWGILVVTLAAWVVFEISGYTLLSLSSCVLLLLTTILFLWAKSAAILNRPSPPLPEMHISEDMMNDVAAFARTHINAVLLAFQNIALGKDTWMYFKVAISLLLISVVGSLTDFLTLGYTSLVVILTVPALYEKYEEHFDKYVMAGYGSAVQFYSKLSEGYRSKVQQWIAEQKKLS